MGLAGSSRNLFTLLNIGDVGGGLGGASHLGRSEDNSETPLWVSEPLAWGLREFASKTFQQNQEGWKSHAPTYQLKKIFMG